MTARFVTADSVGKTSAALAPSCPGAKLLDGREAAGRARIQGEREARGAGGLGRRAEGLMLDGEELMSLLHFQRHEFKGNSKKLAERVDFVKRAGTTGWQNSSKMCRVACGASVAG